MSGWMVDITHSGLKSQSSPNASPVAASGLTKASSQCLVLHHSAAEADCSGLLHSDLSSSVPQGSLGEKIPQPRSLDPFLSRGKRGQRARSAS